MEWNVEEVFKIINLYKQFPCLWDLKSSQYKRTDLKRNAWMEIARNMGKDEEDVKKKIKNLRSAYVAEKRKVESTKKSGSSTEDLYIPHLFYYEELCFLNSAILLRKTTNNIDKQDSQAPTIYFGEENCELKESSDLNDSLLDNGQSQDSFLSINTTDSSGVSKSYGKTCKRKKEERDEKFNTAIDAFVRQADLSCSMMGSKQEDNMYTTFGKSIALQLAQLSLPSAVETMSEIQIIITNKIVKESKNDVLELAVRSANIS